MKVNYLNKEWVIHYCRPHDDDKKYLQICLVDAEGNEIDYNELPKDLRKKVYQLAFNAAEEDEWGRELANGDFLADCRRDGSW